MHVLFLNPPHKTPIVRRYGCSYNSPGYLFPPLELCSAATAVRELNDACVCVVDAVAEKLNANEAVERIKAFGADIVVFITGFESLHEDLAVMDRIKKMTGTKTVCSGYLPTLFPEDVMKKSSTDFVAMGELEYTLTELLDCMEKKKDLDGVAGLAWRSHGQAVVNRQRPRIANLDGLPAPDRRLLKNELYSMPFFGRPFTTIQTSRGCSFRCIYCTHFEGKQFARRSTDNVIRELKDIASLGIRHVRFMDNNFTNPPEKAKELCRRIIEERLDLSWACLTRADLVDMEMAALMKKAGCKTVFVGIESGSEETLKRYKKGYTLKAVRNGVRSLREAGLETIGWFIFGAPWEDDRHFNDGVRLAKDTGLDYAIASVLSYFPGTELFEQEKQHIDFSLFPFRALPKDRQRYAKAVLWEKKFYQEFYMNPSAAFRIAKRALMHPRDAWVSARNLTQYIYSSKKGDFF